MATLVTFGETMLRLSPPGDGRLERTDALDVHVGGAESNVAVAASRLGADATWVSRLPDSPLGRRVVADLRSHGVDVRVDWADAGRQGLYFLESGDPPRGTDVIYDRRDAPITTATLADLPTDSVDRAGIVHTSGITPALSERLAGTTADLLARAAEAGATVSFDVNYRSKLWTPDRAGAVLSDLLSHVDLLVVAERDAATVFGREGDPADVARWFAGEFDLETVVITRSAKGALALSDGTIHDQPAFEAGSPHPIGTGDAFVGGFLARRLRGEALPDALEYAAATAALKRTVPGDAAAITPGEVESVIADRGGGIDR